MTLPASVGRYTVVGELGRGAMGVVYSARDPALDRPVAVKIIVPRADGGASTSSELEARFLREARVAARISHPGVVTVFDAGREGDFLYLVMELIDGESLGERVLRRDFPSAPDALELAAQVAEALGAAHALGVVHRDIKPGNVMITRQGRVKVADFGVAKAAGDGTDLTRTGIVVGSPAYMAPEQVRGEVLDGRADLFSLGVVLYELLMHRKPFPADTVTTLIYQILHEDPLADPNVSHVLGEDAAAFLRRCLAKTVSERIPDAATFASGARTLAAGFAAESPVTGASTATIVTGAVPTRRHPRAGLVVTLVGVGLLALAGAVLLRHSAISPAKPGPPGVVPDQVARERNGSRAPVVPLVGSNLPAPAAPVRVAIRRPTAALTPVSSPGGRKARAPAAPPVTEPSQATGAQTPSAVPPQAVAVPAGQGGIAVPSVVAIFYCRRGAEFNVTPPQALVTVDETAIGQADNDDHSRGDKKYVFSQPGKHYVKLSAPGFRTTWIAIMVDSKATEEFADVDTRLPQQ
ncbi:MAG: protein kinase [Acidobacteriia bacterium]|nr:protein kinase [Terriglobia bacterium]